MKIKRYQWTIIYGVGTIWNDGTRKEDNPKISNRELNFSIDHRDRFQITVRQRSKSFDVNLKISL
jgi:hypothetical protein